MKYPDIIEYTTFLFSVLDEFLLTQESVSKRGSPETYPDASLIVFSAVMTLKGITAMRAQQDYLFHHPLWLKRCRLPRCPSHVPLGRRYKALTPTLEAFTEYVAAWHLTHGGCFRQEVVYVDKSLFKAAGPVWHQKDRLNNEILKGLRGVDTTATWSKSGYHGWVYGYGLHLTATHSGFPVMFPVEPANARYWTPRKRNSLTEARGVSWVIMGMLIKNALRPCDYKILTFAIKCTEKLKTK